MQVQSTKRFRRIFVLLTAVTMLVVTVVSPASAGNEESGTYLALGDSVAAGTQQPQPFTQSGYTNRLYQDLERKYGFDEFVNLACPGDDTREMIDGNDGPGIGSNCYGAVAPLPPGGASQLDVAVAYLAAHPGEVRLITLTIGANDVLRCSPTFESSCLGPELGAMGANLAAILTALKTAAPAVPIVGMNYYNPNLAFWIASPALADASLALMGPFNGTLETVYGGLEVPVADVETAFKTYKTKGTTPQNVRAICTYTLMCEKHGKSLVFSDYDAVAPGPQTDIHPSDEGYKKIAGVFSKLLRRQHIISK